MTETDGREDKVCIDGKQRLTSIFKFVPPHSLFLDTIHNARFLKGEIPCRDPNTKKRYFYRATSANKGRVLMLSLLNSLG